MRLDLIFVLHRSGALINPVRLVCEDWQRPSNLLEATVIPFSVKALISLFGYNGSRC